VKRLFDAAGVLLAVATLRHAVDVAQRDPLRAVAGVLVLVLIASAWRPAR